MTSGHAKSHVSTKRRSRQRGFSLIETLCAIVVLSIGMLGGAVMIMLAATTNNRNKLDNGGTVLSQYIMEVVLGQTANGTGTVTIADCQGNNITIDVDGSAAPGSGAPLTANGSIDFSQGKVANYSATFNSCKASGDPIPYDVRWNITNIRSNGAGTGCTSGVVGCVVYTKQIAVAARPTGGATGNIRNYQLPVTLTAATGQP